MDPEGNRHHSALNGNSRPSDARHTYPSMPHAHSSMLSFYNYLLPPMSSMMYSPFANPNLSWPSSNYFPHPSGWRDASYPLLNFSPDMNAPRNFYINQNSRVIPRDMRQKAQTKVINLESDQEEQKQKIVLVHPINNTHKQSQKQAQVIEIDKISDQKSQKIQIIPMVTKLDITVKNPKPEPILQKVILHKKKQKQLILENKTKQITKLKNKEPKPIEKQQKLQKLQKQRKRKIIQTQKVRLKDQKQKQLEKPQKKKNQKVEKVEKADKIDKIDKNDKNQRNQRNQKLQKAEKNDKNQKNQKNRSKPTGTQNKSKPQEGHTKQIAKYMESHGQIRHGKQFQSDIPASRVNNNIQFNKWLEQKRKKLLKRQIGVLTY